MMNEVSLYRMQEDEGFGAFLIESIGELYGETTPERINRAVYKNTACGAWAKFDETGILVGTIVEGSDAEYHERISLKNIDTDDEGEALLKERFQAAIQRCEEFAEENFTSEE